MPCVISSRSFRSRDGRYVSRKEYEIVVYANFMHGHEKSSESGHGVEWENTILRAYEWEQIGCKLLLQSGLRLASKKGTM